MKANTLARGARSAPHYLAAPKEACKIVRLRRQLDKEEDRAVLQDDASPSSAECLVPTHCGH